MDIFPLIYDINEHLTHLDQWAAEEYPQKAMQNLADTLVIRKEPKGLVLIMGPWNYPFLLVMKPFVGAISAGCTVIIKPSELSSHTSKLLAELVPKYLDPSAYRVLNGGVTETKFLLQQEFDHICYTGSTAVGRIVMKAAAEHLTPVTLELGGKCPAVVDETADLSITAHRLASGKWMNAGQTCIAPDYVICPSSLQPALVDALRNAVKDFYGNNPQESNSYARIINGHHRQRIMKLLNNTKGKIEFGGETIEEENYIAPTVVTGVKLEDALMSEEIFGPVLPMLTYENMEEAIQNIRKRDKPLALYVFSKDNTFINKILDNTQSGGAVVNDCVVHYIAPNLPFGGIGASGMGAYKGLASYEIFTHRRSTLIKTQSLEVLTKLRYPPYDLGNLSLLEAMVTGSVDRTLATFLSGFKGLVTVGAIVGLISVGLRYIK